MIDGITVLSEKFYSDLCAIFFIAFIIALLVTMILYILYKGNCIKKTIVIVFFIVSILLIIASIVSRFTCYESKYKIVVSDSVGFNEFNEHFEIISREGDIIEVVEKK